MVTEDGSHYVVAVAHDVIFHLHCNWHLVNSFTKNVLGSRHHDSVTNVKCSCTM